MKSAALVTSTFASGPLAGEVHRQFAVDYAASAWFTFVTENMKDPHPDYIKTSKPEYPIWLIRQLLLFWYKNPAHGDFGADNVPDIEAETAIATWRDLTAHDRQLMVAVAIEAISRFVDDTKVTQEIQNLLLGHFGTSLEHLIVASD